MSRIVQQGVYPNMDLCPESAMFFRLNSHATLDPDQDSLLLFNNNGKADTSTYFNSLSVGKWKQYTDINQLALRINYRGVLKITFKNSQIGHSTKVLYEKVLDSKDWQQADIELPFWSKLNDGMLYFDIYALEDSCVGSFAYITAVEPVQSIKLGIVITHYNRQQYIIPALEYLKSSLLADKFYATKVALIVVDNSQNLPEIAGVTVIKNANLGGAGGFTRGLIYLKYHSDFTHCLFMDDDASCEVESIRRTIVFLESVKDSKLAVSGAMLMEKEVYRQYESGAYFDGTCHSVDNGLNLIRKSNLLYNERPKRIEYGAWWFFAFDLKQVKYNAFPYFVRGDDISFSYANQFKIVTINGICSWQPDFANKSSPQSVYLDMRNHLMHPLHGLTKGSPVWSMIKSAVVIYGYQVVSYYYDSAMAATIAMEDVLKGPRFWRDNINMLAKRKQINDLIMTEKPVPLPENAYSECIKTENICVNNNLARKMHLYLGIFIRYLTLNGHLLPSVLFRNGSNWVEKSLGSRMTNSFRYKTMVVVMDEGDKCYILKHSKKKFFGYSFRFAYLLVKLIIKHKKLMEVYKKTYPELTSDEFWQEQYQKEMSQEKS